MKTKQVKTDRFIVNIQGSPDLERIKTYCVNYLKKANIKEVKK